MQSASQPPEGLALLLIRGKSNMAGNAITDPQNQYIGTSDSIAVVFRTNNIEALRLAANKNIGMGVNEPTAKLDIAGTVRVRENLLIDSLAFTPDQNNPASLRALLVIAR